jgi:hypothetical protein
MSTSNGEDLMFHITEEVSGSRGRPIKMSSD